MTAELERRERLRPYLNRLMAEAACSGVAPMRPLFVDHRDDPTAWEIEDQFLLGREVLVASAGSRSRQVYLPAGRDWVEAGTGVEYKGGAWVTADTPLERIPVFLAADASPEAAMLREA